MKHSGPFFSKQYVFVNHSWECTADWRASQYTVSVVPYTSVYACVILVSLTTGLMPCAATHLSYIECVHIAEYKYASPLCDPVSQ